MRTTTPTCTRILFPRRYWIRCDPECCEQHWLPGALVALAPAFSTSVAHAHPSVRASRNTDTGDHRVDAWILALWFAPPGCGFIWKRDALGYPLFPGAFSVAVTSPPSIHGEMSV